MTLFINNDAPCKSYTYLLSSVLIHKSMCVIDCQEDLLHGGGGGS